MEETDTIKTEGLMQKESTLLEWDANEFHSYERNWKWYVAILAVALAVVGYSVYSKDWFILAIVPIVLIFLFIYAKKQPQSLHYRITQLGVYAGEHFYPYSDIHSFWLVLRERERKLNIIFIKKYLPQLTILLNEVDPLQIKTVLGKYLPEQENRSETFVDLMLRLLKLQ